MEIVVIYSDEGKSGLNIQGRGELARMISDVQSKRADYKCILVYDISRWGRFQMRMKARTTNTSVSAQGSQFIIAPSNLRMTVRPVPPSSKRSKRAMAGEYSRELLPKYSRGLPADPS